MPPGPHGDHSKQAAATGLLEPKLVKGLTSPPQPMLQQSEALRLTCAVKYSSDGVPFGCTLDCGTYVTKDLHCGTPRCCGVSSSSVRVPACRAFIVMQQGVCAWDRHTSYMLQCSNSLWPPCCSAQNQNPSDMGMCTVLAP